MKPLKIHTITERVILQDTTHQQHQQQQFSSSLYIYEIIYSVEEENYIRIERNLNDIILLVQSVVLYFPSYQFSAGVLFQPPDQQIRNLLDLQEFLNRIFSIDVGTRLIQYPKVIAFFDPVFAKSVTQRSLMKQSLKAISNLEKAVDNSLRRLGSLETSLARCLNLLQNLQPQENQDKKEV
mmetsp:Transcript_5200/g.5689  ORF Transcript_5200/g.5689 Transcript_5200/m.5689 type:complete len:181 (-) Transcript_5200:722-1264(-)